MSLILVMEGISQFISWHHITEYINTTFHPLLTADADSVLQVLNETVSSVLSNPSLPVTQNEFESLLSEVASINNPNVTEIEAQTNIQNITTGLLKLILDGFGFEPPTETGEPRGPKEIVEAYSNVFSLVFGYFFISFGLALIFIAVLSWLSHSKGRHEIYGHLWSIITKFVLGLGLVLCSTMVLTDAAKILGSSAWTLPLLLFLLAFSLCAQHIPPCSARAEQRNSSLV